MAHPAIRLLFLFVCGASISGQTAPDRPTYPVAQAPAVFLDAVQRGDAVVGSMQTALLAELSKEMLRGGAEGAVRVCHLDAAAVTEQVARKQGIAAGRTSHRLRSPTNAPRPWAAPIVSGHAGKPIAGIEGFVVDLGDKVGLLRPIGIRAACLGCHGPREQLAPAVLSELTERYPGDQATGFKEGDLRGWFWVEIPKG